MEGTEAADRDDASASAPAPEAAGGLGSGGSEVADHRGSSDVPVDGADRRKSGSPAASSAPPEPAAPIRSPSPELPLAAGESDVSVPSGAPAGPSSSALSSASSSAGVSAGMYQAESRGPRLNSPV
jgi:hypothetical protein